MSKIKPPPPPPPSPLDRLFTNGPNALTLEELYSLLLDIPASEIRPLLATLLQADTLPRTLPGFTTLQIARTVAIGELITRQQDVGKEEWTFWTPEEVATFFQRNGYVREQSYIHLLMFNSEYQLINPWYTPFYPGPPTLATIRPADIYREAIRYRAHSVVIVHTHATRNPTPTAEALDFIRTVGQTAITLDIRIHDYLTIGTQGVHALSRHPDLANPPSP